MITERNKQLLTLQKTATRGLTKADLDKLNSLVKLPLPGQDIDTMSDFSINTQESVCLAKENLLDIRFSTGALDKATISQLLSPGQDLSPSQVCTFLSVDFYNHESKMTDKCQGLEPIYNTLMTFKNTVDDFYLKHLETDFMTVDVLAAQSADKKR